MDVKERILLTVVMTRSKVLELEAAAFREIAAMLDEEPPGSIVLPPLDPVPPAKPTPEAPPTTEVQPTTEAPPAPEVAPAPEEPSAVPAAPEAPPAPMPAEDPGPSPRRRGRPRKAVTDDATPSLLPHSEPPAAPAEVAEPAEPMEPVVVTDASQDVADDLPW